MGDNKFLALSWNDFHDVCFDLSQTIKKKNIKFDRILAISRGGLVVARILSDFLNLPISVFTMVAYTGINKCKQAKVVEGLKIEPKGETVLLIDEVADSGETYKKALSYLKTFTPKKIYTCAPYIKSWTKYKPDFWQVKSNKWIIFPYEAKETINELKQNMSLKDLKKLNFLPKQLQEFIKN